MTVKFYSTGLFILFFFINLYSNPVFHFNSTYSGEFEEPKTAFSYHVIPFELVGKLIVVEAFVDNRKGHFIIDTGSESLLLNARFFSGIKNHEVVARNFSGQRSAISQRGVRFSWLGHSEKTFLATIVDLKHLEKQIQFEIIGYIGYDVLKDYEFVLDFQFQEITLFELDKKGRRNSSSLLHTHATDTLQLKANNHMPFLMASIGSQKLKLGIDSGAALPLFRPRVQKKLRSYLTAEEQRLIIGFDGKEAQIISGRLFGLKLNDLTWPAMPSLISNLSHINNNLETPLDGILGFEFLRRYKIAFNYKKNQIYLWNPGGLQPVKEIQKTIFLNLFGFKT